jgi:23S rRNA (uridine2552-2'-O)-methyltransferase
VILVSRWVHERKDDYFYKLAKEEGYRSRAAYKLKQINNKFGIFENAKYVLDLGAAPGGWLQVASEEVDPNGLLLGVDLEEITPLYARNIFTIKGDIRDREIQETVLNFFKGKIDVVLSDIAPDLSGQWDLDQYRQIYLARIALKISYQLLKPNGWFVVKIFQGREHVKFINQVKQMFDYVKNYKPRASRKGSAEIYVVAQRVKKYAKMPRIYKERIYQDEEEDFIPGDQLLFDTE